MVALMIFCFYTTLRPLVILIFASLQKFWRTEAFVYGPILPQELMDN